jgi:hypothetical protein
MGREIVENLNTLIQKHEYYQRNIYIQVDNSLRVVNIYDYKLEDIQKLIINKKLYYDND